MSGSDPERIIAAAIRHKGLTAYIEAPARHGDIISYLSNCGWYEGCHGEQGFVTSTGRFVDRVMAVAVARRSGQVRDDFKARAGQLFSEDLW